MKHSMNTAIYRYREDGSYISLEECARAMYAVGYRDLDPNLCKVDEDIELTRDDWESWAHHFREVLDELGMTTGQSHAPFYLYNEKPTEFTERREEMTSRAIIASGIFGTSVIVFHAVAAERTDREANKRLNLEYFKRRLELAERCGISIAIENMCGRKGDDGKRIYRYATCAEELIDLTDTLKKDFGNVGICWDFGHANMAGLDQAKALTLMGKRLIAVHIHDNDGTRDQHLLPYQGNLDWKTLMRTLKDIGYSGTLNSEAVNVTKGMPDPLLPAMLRYSAEVGEYLVSLYER